MYGCRFINVLIFKNEILSRLPYALWVYQMRYNVILTHNFLNKNVLLWGWNKMTSSIWHLCIKRVLKRLMIVGSQSNFFDVHCFFFPTRIHHLSLPEWVTHTFTYINYGAFITSLPTYLDKNMVGFFPCVQFPFWWHFRLIINSRQSKYPKPVFLFFMYFSFLFSVILCLGDVLLGSYLDLWIFGKLFADMGDLKIHIISLYIVSLFYLSSVFQFLIIWIWYLITSWLNYLLSFNFDLFLNCYQKDVKKIPEWTLTDI